MALSYDLLSQFAKVVNTKPKTSTESTVYGVVVEDSNGNKYVRPDGVNPNTPVEQLIQISDANVDAKKDDRVSVLIKDHTATVTGNMSSPATSITTVKDIEKILTDSIDAQTIRVNALDAKKIEAADLDAAKAEIAELYAEKATVEKLSADVAEIDQVVAKKIDTEIANATYATIKNLEATDAKVGTLEAAHADLKQATVENLDAANAEIDELKAKDAEIENLVSEKASVEDLNAANAKIDKLDTDKANVKDLDATNAEIANLGTKYANIDFANINEAAIRKIFSDTGIIKILTVGENLTITGELVGVTLKGDLIEAGTLKADRLVVLGSDGNYYKLNTDFAGMPGVEPVEEDAIHGSVLIKESITAEKISVQDLVAFGATIGGFQITNNAIHSHAKESVDSTINGIYMDRDGQISIGDGTQCLKYYRDQNGEYKLAISASSIIFSTGDRNVEDELNNLEIGAKNLIRNSTDLIFEQYAFNGSSATLGVAIIGAMILGEE